MKNQTNSFGTDPQIPVYPDDGALVGRDQILSSPRVVEAPSRVNNPVDVPSVYVDGRGEIHNFEIGGRRLNLMFTKAGVKRSGDLHRHSQHDFVFSGRVEVVTMEADGSSARKLYNKYQYFCIPPFTPHVFNFLEDSVLAEWWDGPFHAWFYVPYRELVDATLSVKGKGRFLYYSLSSSKVSNGSSKLIPFVKCHGYVFLGGLLTGLLAGVLLRKRRA